MRYYSQLSNCKILSSAFCLSILLTFLSLPSFAAGTPDETLKLFYKLVSQQKCEKAIKLRPDYALERCKKITKAHIHKVSTELSDNKNAVLLLELDSFVNGKKSYFFGYVKLTKKKNKWRIIGPFKNREDYWLDEYVNAYIPEGINGLSVKEKKQKFTPPPVKKFNPKQTPAPIEEVQPTQKNVIETPKTSPIKKTTDKSSDKKTVKKEKEAVLPPGDSIDADEFKETHTAGLQQTQITSATKATTHTTMSHSITPEADKFILGEHPIEGNYTSLLGKIRKNFPAQASSNILLIDQSRNTIYVYNKTNLLLAFFPILSSDNSNFPSGLYRLNSGKPLDSKSQKTQLDNQAITLERIQKTMTASPESQTKQEQQQALYYIRDLFDADKSRSLQLSPIDNNKLQQLILPSTMAYKGQ